MNRKGRIKGLLARLLLYLFVVKYLWSLAVILRTVDDMLDVGVLGASLNGTHAHIKNPQLLGRIWKEETLKDERVKSLIAEWVESHVDWPPPDHRNPNFIILGAQKAGTTALVKYLWQHPFIEVPTRYKEPHFFDRWYEHTNAPQQNLKVYRETFHDRDCRKEQCIAGESTPYYLFDWDIPRRAHKICPWVKLVVILRDPVARAYSHYTMLDAVKGLNVTFEEFIEEDWEWMKQVGLVGNNKTLTREEEDNAWMEYFEHPNWYELPLGRGLYEIQLRRWFKFFPRRQFLILKSTDLDHNRSDTMRQVHKFLVIPKVPILDNRDVHVGAYTAPMPEEVKERLIAFYRPYNERLAELLGPKWNGIWNEPESEDY